MNCVYVCPLVCFLVYCYSHNSLNPQLRCLILGSRHDPAILRCASQHIEVLEYLSIDTYTGNLKKFGDEVFHFACLKELKMSCMIDYMDHIKNIPISSDCLKEFSFHFKFREGSYKEDILIHFLKKHPTITKLNLTCDPKKTVITDIESLIGIIKALPSIEEIVITMVTISVNDAIQFVKNCKSLKKLCFRVDENADIDYLKTSLEVKWQAKITKLNDITIVKRHN